MTIAPELVINFHMTEACNYRCGYCYATWQGHELARELHRNSSQLKALIRALAEGFLRPNPLQAAMGYESVRLNFAGGEPMLLGDRFLAAVDDALAAGFRTSIITNGHFMDDSSLDALAPRLSLLGVSCDSVNPALQATIGRVDRHGRRLTTDHLLRIFAHGRKLNPALSTKLNTVVNLHNWQDDLNAFVAAAAPDKWKVLRALPVHNHNLTISDEQFLAYLERHARHATLMAPEDNSTMAESYLMVNPEGRFYQNSHSGAGYVMSDSILEVGVAVALGQVQFNTAAFARRYQKIPVTPV